MTDIAAVHSNSTDPAGNPEISPVSVDTEILEPGSVRDLLKSADIGRVVFIDDNFNFFSDSPELILQGIRSGVIETDMLKQASELIEEITEMGDLTDFDSDQRAILAEALEGKELSGETIALLSSQNDSYLVMVGQLLGPDIKCLGLSPEEWREQRSQILAFPENQFIFFDVFFGDLRQGDALAADLVKEIVEQDRHDIWCGVLSHVTEQPVDQWVLLRESHGLSNIQAARMFWISKTTLNNPDELFLGLSIMLIAPALVTLQDLAGEGLASQIDTVIAETKQFDALMMYSALFSSQFEEGVFEPAVLIRLWTAKASKKAMMDLAANDASLAMATRLRLVAETPMTVDDSACMAVVELQRHEFYYSYDDLRNRCFQVEPGDVFAFVKVDDVERLFDDTDDAALHDLNNVIIDPATRHFVLIAQGCDVMVRSDGERRVSNRYFDGASLKRAESSGGRPGLRVNDAAVGEHGDGATTFCLPIFHVDGRDGLVDLRNPYQIPIEALDACVFNEFGVASISQSDKSPASAMPGQIRRHAALKNSALKIRDVAGSHKKDKRPKLVRAIAWGIAGTDGPDVFDARMSESDNERLSWGIVRVGRVTEPYRSALVLAFELHKARPAFDALVVTKQSLSSFDNPAAAGSLGA